MEDLRNADLLLADARALLAEHASVRAQAAHALDALRRDVARAGLESVPVSRLKDVTGGRLRISTLEKAGFGTVRQVLDATPYELQSLPGIGARTAGQIHAAARQIEQAAAEAASLRLDVDRPDHHTTELVVCLHRLVVAGPDLPRALEAAGDLAERLAPLLAQARPARSRLRMMFTLPARRRRAREAVEEIEALLDGAAATRLLLAQVTADLLRPPARDFEAWADFESRSPEYFALLAELAGEPLGTGQGLLPDDLAAKVAAQPLDDTHRRVSLRGYQAFGARFSLAQERVIIGDEMGLGKSIEAIAALAHLQASGDTHFLVVCPASVLINWVREIGSRSTLRAYPLHGPDRPAARREWLRDGGVAVATLDGLHRLGDLAAVELGMLVVDEAHYVKNPETRRSRAVAAWCGRTRRVLFLTGTPMENRVEEFRTLISYLRPDLAAELRSSDVVAGARAFRKAVAPVYLRRNQQDVLAELPERVEADEWVEFSGADFAVYREAVAEGNFMAMRRAAYAEPATSAKLKRLLELVEDAAANGLKVVVFSYFRAVLAAVGAALDGRAHGPLSGDVPAERRQQLVDEFSAAAGHAVLLSQVQAGGVGLNLQAASVVILCEPQVKPSMETQAVGRAHRMGQVRRVQVHRLLTVDSVDQRMLDILRRKSRLFDAYARRSDLAESSGEAMDVSEQTLARLVIEEEQRRLLPGGS
ncbi:DEAD/DEAH box helicase [Nonomuraea gerenzanensis]|uniref:COG0553: Superfamily II DNA/RNA helicases, SNF2 family n=1 Tax=Nonomuraea gerenzanensis TaxID=93944 RepID=A0A1M4E8T5_9ACTN|nr:SNF2-related protein [Nonomuraea gerenzanensis]UBU17429.1 ATP-dependent helicase [Nonomuraea gerenzanensis]SBO95184.1 COG0553: Superfamily II DNA/RNA helicases, SNF2 family [Nonomuraea gerenzanensis]